MNILQPQAIPQEQFNPDLARAVVNPFHARVSPASAPPIYLMRHGGAREAYALIEERSPIENHRPGWGDVVFAVVYEAIGADQFRAPRKAEEVRYVAIKRLNKEAVNRDVNRGGAENPYKDICRMRELGNNQQVLQCVDALEDDTTLYIITPKACSLGTLADVVFQQLEHPMDVAHARAIFRQILEILAYLNANDISHRDFTPDNFIFLSPSNLVVFDLAMSHRLPRNSQGQRVPALPQSFFGTLAYTPPEMVLNRVWDGHAADLWSSAVMLYNLLTSLPLYRSPFPHDLLFRYNILAEGAFTLHLNEAAIEVLQDTTDGQVAREIRRTALTNLNQLDAASTEVLQNSLEINPDQRWSLQEVLESDFVQGIE